MNVTLSPTQDRVLQFLKQEVVSASMPYIADRLILPKPTVRRTMAELMAKSLVARRQSCGNKILWTAVEQVADAHSL